MLPIIQVVGVEGHNPSGHCLIASNIIDHVPLFTSTTTEEEHPSKRQALDHDFQLSEASLETPELSLVCILAFSFTLHACILLILLIFYFYFCKCSVNCVASHQPLLMMYN